MKRLLLATLVVLGLALMGTIIYSITINHDRNNLNTELKSVQSILASTQVELDSTKQTLDSTKQTLISTQSELITTKLTLTLTQSELGSTKNTLASTQGELTSTQSELTSTQSELTSTQQTLSSVQQASTNLQDTLSNTEQKLAVAQETLGGLGITVSASYECFDVNLIDNPEAKNPTWRELMTFISKDKTENHTYIAEEYDCSQFSRDVHNNAEVAGIRAAEVQVFFENEKTGHALNAFLTTDYGLVYVDCTQAPDMIAYLKAGKAFKAVQADWITGTNVRNDSWWDMQSSYYYLSSSTGAYNITSSIIIYW